MRGFRVASLEETLRYGRPELARRGLRPAMAGGDGFALVGTIGAVSVGAVNTDVTPAWGTNENRSRQNLLVCWCVGFGTNTLPTIPSGWGQDRAVQGTNCSAIVYRKSAANPAGGDVAPTIAAVAGTSYNVQLAEFSGAGPPANSDRTFVATGITSPLVATAASPNDTPGELFVSCAAMIYTVAATNTTTDTYNNGATATRTTNDATSTVNHYAFGYGVTTGNTVAPSDSFAYTVTNITGAALVGATFDVLPPPWFPHAMPFA